jgi:hypothetical protein
MSHLFRAGHADSQHLWLGAIGVSVTLMRVQWGLLYDSSAVEGCDTASAVVARKGNCSDRREGAGSTMLCATMIDETRVVITVLGTRDRSLQYFEKRLRRIMEDSSTWSPLFHRREGFQMARVKPRECGMQRHMFNSRMLSVASLHAAMCGVMCGAMCNGAR